MKHLMTSLVPLALLLGGCATNTATPPERKIIVSEDQTELIKPTGSHISTRVLKGQKPITASPVSSASGESVNDSLLTRDGTFPSVPVH